MTSKKYWEMRSAQDMVDRMGTAEQTAAEMNKAISQSAEYIAKEVKAVFRGMESLGISETEAKKILNAANNKTALQSLRAAARRVSDPEKRQALLKAIDSAGAYRYRIDRLEQLNKQINAKCRELYKTENRAVTSALRTVASDSYYHSIFNIQQETGLGFSFAEFSQKDIDRILRSNWLGGNYSQRIWKNVNDTAEAVKRELLVSMLSGRSSEKTARIIRERFGVNSYCARRIVRTESAYVANAAQMSAYDEAGIEKYRFVATLDSRTSEACAALDGKVFPASEAKAGTNYPPMHPFCRSTTIADFGNEQLKRLERRARDKDGNTIKVPADMTYEEWKKGLDKSAESGIIEAGSGNVALEYQRYGRNKNTLVNKTYIDSGEYRRKFDKLTDNPDVNKAVYDCAKSALKHRSGTELEDMYWFDGATGKIIAKELNSTNPRQVVYSAATKSAVGSAESKSIIALHTHPSSMPPSIEDFNACFRHGYKCGFIACHNGKIYGYSSEQLISAKLYELCVGDFLDNGLPEFEAQTKALEELRRNHKIDFWEVK